MPTIFEFRTVRIHATAYIMRCIRMYVSVYLAHTHTHTHIWCSRIIFDVHALSISILYVKSLICSFSHSIVCCCVKTLQMCPCVVLCWFRSIVVYCVVFFHCEVIITHATTFGQNRILAKFCVEIIAEITGSEYNLNIIRLCYVCCYFAVVHLIRNCCIRKNKSN